MKNYTYKWNDYLLILLNSNNYFKSQNREDEVQLKSREQMIDELRLNGTTKYFEDKKFLEEHIASVKIIAGAYIGSTENHIKLEPFCGLTQEAYFIIPKEQIKKIININRIKV